MSWEYPGTWPPIILLISRGDCSSSILETKGLEVRSTISEEYIFITVAVAPAVLQECLLGVRAFDSREQLIPINVCYSTD